MRQFYSICIASHDEVLFRDESDYNMFTNLMAIAAYRAKVELLADAIMSTHVHLAVMAHDPTDFVASLRQSYGKYFNRKYGRQGRLGPKGFYMNAIEGPRHRIQLICYILRNGLHHGQSATPFGYKFCTTGSLFMKELGRDSGHIITSRSEIQAFLPREADFPDTFFMNEQHVFLRESFMEIKTLEATFFSTARNFLYQMNRITDEYWIDEQANDKTDEKPVTIYTVERGFDRSSIEKMLASEKYSKFDASVLNDIDVCHIIDTQMIAKYKAGSVYALTDTQKQKISQTLQKELKVPKFRAERCLGIVADTSGKPPALSKATKEPAHASGKKNAGLSVSADTSGTAPNPEHGHNGHGSR